jgi:hypothetical protein
MAFRSTGSPTSYAAAPGSNSEAPVRWSVSEASRGTGDTGCQSLFGRPGPELEPLDECSSRNQASATCSCQRCGKSGASKGSGPWFGSSPWACAAHPSCSLTQRHCRSSRAPRVAFSRGRCRPVNGGQEERRSFERRGSARDRDRRLRRFSWEPRCARCSGFVTLDTPATATASRSSLPSQISHAAAQLERDAEARPPRQHPLARDQSFRLGGDRRGSAQRVRGKKWHL